ncbi:MAG: hypothetical protein C0605_10730 [Hyphomicrobiales bacterium]|nr:MAG: hypothetical protein C0605_10730 [Hyphomicrobiales bacterium]
MGPQKEPGVFRLRQNMISVKKSRQLSFLSWWRRLKATRSAHKRHIRADNAFQGQPGSDYQFSDNPYAMVETNAEHTPATGLWRNPKKTEITTSFGFDIKTDINPQNAACQILIVCQHAPTVKHAGGLRILDMLHKIKRKHARTYIELFSSADLHLYGTMAEVTQIVDQVVIAEKYNFSLTEYLHRTPECRYFDIVDFQAPQPPEIVESYRHIGRKLIFTPMESHIRNECIEREIELIPEKDLISDKAIEEAKLCRLVDQTVCVSNKDRDAVASCVKADVVAIETCISDIEFNGEHVPINPNDQAVCYVAYFGSETNREALIWYLNNVHPKICEALTDYEFRIIGQGDISDILAGKHKAVRYIGEVDRIAPHIKAAAVGIAPALSGSGFRGKISQHAFLGIPTVATSLAAEGLAYKHGHSIMISDDPEVFADCVIKLLQDGRLRRQISEAAADVCQSAYVWESKWQDITKVYDLPPNPDVISMPTVHAVVPSYQHAPFIEERLRSIFGQEYPNIRVSVIDDHSNDGSHEIIERLRGEFEFDYIRKDQNSGTPFSAWKYAAENTTEDLIWICESDDSCDSFLVGKLVKLIMMRNRTKIAYSASWMMDEHGEACGSTDNYFSKIFHPTRWQRAFIADGSHELHQYQRFGMVLPNMSSALIDSAVFKAAFTPSVMKYKLAGDWLFVGQAMQLGDIAYTPERLNRFRQHDETARTRTDIARRTAEHVSVRLSLSAQSGASERDIMEAVKYDLRELCGNPDLADQVRIEMKNLDPDHEKQLAALLKEHCSHGGLGNDLAKALENRTL